MIGDVVKTAFNRLLPRLKDMIDESKSIDASTVDQGRKVIVWVVNDATKKQKEIEFSVADNRVLSRAERSERASVAAGDALTGPPIQGRQSYRLASDTGTRHRTYSIYDKDAPPRTRSAWVESKGGATTERDAVVWMGSGRSRPLSEAGSWGLLDPFLDHLDPIQHVLDLQVVALFVLMPPGTLEVTDDGRGRGDHKRDAGAGPARQFGIVKRKCADDLLGDRE